MQEESARLAREAAQSGSQVTQLQAEAKAALQDAQEALARESDVQQLLQAADRVRLFCPDAGFTAPGLPESSSIAMLVADQCHRPYAQGYNRTFD